MASVKGVNITALDDGTGKLSKIEKGKERVFIDTYEASSLASGSDITICRLPKNSAVVDAVIYHDALGGSSTLSLGDADDVDRYITAGSSASAGALRMNAVDGCGFENANGVDLIVTTGGASITGTLKVVVKYLV